MIYIDASAAIKQARKANRDLSPIEFKRAIARAMNRTTLNIRTQSTKKIRYEYRRLKAKDIKQTLDRQHAYHNDLEARLTSTGGVLNIYKLRPRFTSRGASVLVKRKTKRMPGVFKSTMPNKRGSGHTGAFARGYYRNNKFVTRRKRIKPYGQNDLPITEIKTVAVPSTFKNDQVIRETIQVADTRLRVNMKNEINFRKLKAQGLL